MKEQAQHRLVILGSMDEFVELVRIAKERGVYTICCDGYPDGVAKTIADKSYTIDIHQVEQIAQMCIDEKADGIITSFSDTLFEQATLIADKAGLPWYVKPDVLKYYREKDRAKALLTKLGVKVPRNIRLAKDFSDDALKDFTFPVVIKPVDGYGSKGIYVVRSTNEIRELWEQVAERGKNTKNFILAEEYSQGREFNMMTWMIDGVVYPISLADREKNPQTGRKIPLLNRLVYPSKFTQTKVLPTAVSVLQKFAAATGQTSGALSMQFFYHDGHLEVCEIAGRLFGYEHELVTYCYGLKIEEVLLDYVYDPDALEKTMKAHSLASSHCCAGLYFNGRHGKSIADMSCCEQLGKEPEVLECKTFYCGGETVDNYSPKPHLVRYYLHADSREKLDQLTQHFFSQMSVPGTDGEDVDYKLILETDEL